jgi:hypothetical protein
MGVKRQRFQRNARKLTKIKKNFLENKNACMNGMTEHHDFFEVFNQMH